MTFVTWELHRLQIEIALQILSISAYIIRFLANMIKAF